MQSQPEVVKANNLTAGLRKFPGESGTTALPLPAFDSWPETCRGITLPAWPRISEPPLPGIVVAL